MSLVFFALAAIANSVMDSIAHHFPRSWFAVIRNPYIWLWVHSDWLDAYIDRDPSKGFKGLRRFAPLRDGWHFSKACMIVCLVVSVITYKPILPQWWMDALAYLLAWWIGFNVIYIGLIRRG